MRTSLFLLLLSWVAASTSSKLPACAVAPQRGMSVGIDAEEAIILYDAANRTEHFIRRGSFRTEAKDFGFLVPTPSQPTLGETNADIFATLDNATAAKREFSGKVNRIVRKGARFAYVGAAPAPADSSPKVIDRGTSAGLDYVVLKADDLDGLKKWLEKHKYDSRPALMDWLKWYVDNSWYLTAFKMSQVPSAASDRWNKSVRMSFRTDKPFYPYREPADMSTGTSPRSLRVFFLADTKQEGGDWPARTVWAGTCQTGTQQVVLGGMNFKPDEAKRLNDAKWYLTEFEDTASPRPGTKEVYFASAKDQTGVERPIIYYDRYEYDEEPEIAGFLSLTGVLAIAAVALSVAALLGYVVIVKKRNRD